MSLGSPAMRDGRPGLARLIFLAPSRSRTVDAVLVALAAAMAFASYSANLPLGAAAFGRAGSAAWAMLVVAPGVALTATGLFARRAWPQSRIGLLMVAEGLTYNVGMLAFTSTYIPVASEVSALVAWIPFAICAHVLLSYPSGRLARRRDRMLVIALYAWVAPGIVVTYLFHGPGGDGCPVCPANGFLLSPDQALDYATNVGWAAGMAALLVVVAAVAQGEHRRATPLARRARLPVHVTRWVALLAAAGYFALGMAPSLTLTAWPSRAYALVNLALLLAPVGIVLALIREREADASPGQLARRLARAPTEPLKLESELRIALADPSARLLFHDHQGSRWIGTDGQALEAFQLGRALTWPPRPERPRVALAHDPALDRGRAESALAVVDLALDGARLRALLRASPPNGAAVEKSARDTTAGLTRREHEVMALVVAGLTDRAIAERLFLTRRTVETHIGHAFAKLDVPVGPQENRRVHAVRRLLGPSPAAAGEEPA